MNQGFLGSLTLGLTPSRMDRSPCLAAPSLADLEMRGNCSPLAPEAKLLGAGRVVGRRHWLVLFSVLHTSLSPYPSLGGREPQLMGHFRARGLDTGTEAGGVATITQEMASAWLWGPHDHRAGKDLFSQGTQRCFAGSLVEF